MYREPLPQSQILIERGAGDVTYSWSNGKSGILAYPVALFLLCWLGGWTVGGIMAMGALLFGKDMPLSGRLFILFWLGGWACGEAAVVSTLYGMLGASAGFTPLPGMEVIAWVNNRACGQALTQSGPGGEVVYALDVEAASVLAPGCGTPGDAIVLFVDGMPMFPWTTWTNWAYLMWGLQEARMKETMNSRSSSVKA